MHFLYNLYKICINLIIKIKGKKFFNSLKTKYYSKYYLNIHTFIKQSDICNIFYFQTRTIRY
jgi:hypothetical protein